MSNNQNQNRGTIFGASVATQKLSSAEETLSLSLICRRLLIRAEQQTPWRIPNIYPPTVFITVPATPWQRAVGCKELGPTKAMFVCCFPIYCLLSTLCGFVCFETSVSRATLRIVLDTGGGIKEGRKERKKERMPRLPTVLSHIPQNGNVQSDNVELSVVRTTVH